METNFKVDVPSFALGYSAGKKKGGSGGGVELNIAYGDTPPEDTSKLWVKTTKPQKVVTGPLYYQVELESDGAANAGAISDSTCRLTKTCCARVGDFVYTFGGRYRVSATDSNTCAFICKFKKSSAARISATVPRAGTDMCCAAVGDKIYVFVCNDRTEIFRFDTTDETIVTLEEAMPTANKNMICASVGKKIYVFGGYSEPDSIYCFDAETEKVAKLSATLKKGCWSGGCAAVGNKIYIFGGFNSADGVLDIIQCLDTETGETSILPVKLPSGKYGMGCAAVGDKIVVYGGVAGLNGINYVRNTSIQVFDARYGTVRQARNTVNSCLWSSIAPHPSSDREVMMVGGCLNSSTRGSDSGQIDYMFTYKLPLDIELEEGTLFLRNDFSSNGGNEFTLAEITGLEVKATPYYIFKGMEGDVGIQVELLQYIDGAWVTKG